MGLNEQDVLIAIRADNAQLVAKLKEARAELAKMKPAATDGMRGFVDGMSGAITKVTFLTAAVAGVAVGIYEAGKKSSEIKKIETSFNNLSASAGSSGKAILKAMEEASGGTVAQTDLMKSANQALKLMGDDAVKMLPELTQIAVASANSTGESVEKALGDTITAVARQSVEVLDNVGISAASTKKYVEEYATQLGKSSDKLTEGEKKAAFYYAVHKAGGELIKAQGGNVAAMGSEWDKLSVSMKNGSDSLIRIMDRVEPVLAIVNKSLNETSDAQSVFGVIVRGLAAVGSMSLNMITALVRLSANMYSPSKWKGILEDWHKTNVKIIDDAFNTDEKATQITKTGSGKRTETIRMALEKQKELNEAYHNYLSERHDKDVQKETVSYGNVAAQQVELYNAGVINYQEYKARLAAITDEYNEREIIASQASAATQRQSKEDLYLSSVGFKSQEYSATSQIMDNMASLMQAKDKRLFMIGKIAAIGRAVMNIAEGATKALSYGPILGPILAATVIAAGAVQIGTIKAQQYGGSSSTSSVAATTATDEAVAQTPKIASEKGVSLNGYKIKGFASGSWNVPSDMLAMIHKGEKIITTSLAQSVDRGDAVISSGAGRSGGDINIIVQGSVVDAQGLLNIVNNSRSRYARNTGQSDFYSKSVYS